MSQNTPNSSIASAGKFRVGKMRKPLALLVVLVLLGGGVWWFVGGMGDDSSEVAESLVSVTQGTGIKPTDPEMVSQVQDLENDEQDPQDSGAAAPKAESSATLADALVLAEELRENVVKNVKDYTATLVKRERINGKLQAESAMLVKVRNPVPSENKGLAAYFLFESPKSSKGREVIWVDGMNENKVIAHEAGFKRVMGTLRLDPDGRLAMMGQKYPVYEVGMLRLVEKLIEKGNSRVLKSQAKIKIDENVMVGQRPCQMIQVTIPNEVAEADFHVAKIFVDKEFRVPVRYAAYLWPEVEGGEPPLEEEYTYLNVRLNVGLADEDFDPENENYDFP